MEIQKDIKDELDRYIEIVNDLPVVNSLITELGYSRAGLQIRKQGNVVAEVTSIHENGRISNVLKGFHNPEIIVKIEEEHLMEMYENREWILENPYKAALKYWNKVKLPLNQKIKIGSVVFKKLKSL